jgi:hypothetical protein
MCTINNYDTERNVLSQEEHIKDKSSITPHQKLRAMGSVHKKIF